MRILILLALIYFGSLPAFSQVFEVHQNTLTYTTEDHHKDNSISFGHAERLLFILESNRNINLLKLHSYGGSTEAAKYMARIIIDANINTHVDKECSSSCLRLFLAGNKRTANLGVKFGFHRGTWSAESLEKYYKKYKDIEDWKTPFEFSSWVYDETQKDVYEFITYLIDRGVSSDIAAKTYRLGSDEMWYPHRKELLSSGILTE